MTNNFFSCNVSVDFPSDDGRSVDRNVAGNIILKLNYFVLSYIFLILINN